MNIEDTQPTPTAHGASQPASQQSEGKPPLLAHRVDALLRGRLTIPGSTATPAVPRVRHIVPTVMLVNLLCPLIYVTVMSGGSLVAGLEVTLRLFFLAHEFGIMVYLPTVFGTVIALLLRLILPAELFMPWWPAMTALLISPITLFVTPTARADWGLLSISMPVVLLLFGWIVCKMCMRWVFLQVSVPLCFAALLIVRIVNNPAGLTNFAPLM